MTISIKKDETSITIENNTVMSIDNFFDAFVYCLCGLDYEISDIEQHIITLADKIKNNHNENISTI